MATWAKNLIVKQLAKFAKNIDPSQISLKFLKGEGELLNLELNEAVLSDLLELPPWLKLTKVTCDRITAKIKWTSLKTDPIRLFLDNVEVVLEASDTVRQKASRMPDLANLQKDPSAKPNSYGFGEKVVDGMYVAINTVSAVFMSFGFKAAFSMSRIIIQSTTPTWRVPDNLRLTRIKDEQRDQVLTFKEIKWSTLRIEADATYQPGVHFQSAPLRLITNNSALKLTIKKSLSTCEVLASRLNVLLEDILIVLTQSQLLRLSSFINFVLKLREKYLPFTLPDVNASLAAAQQQLQQHVAGSQPVNRPRTDQGVVELNPVFTRFDFAETSYHIRSQRIDFHLCDDSTLDGAKTTASYKGSSAKSPGKGGGGALQVTFTQLAVDHCPYHVSGCRRKLWAVNETSAISRQQWAEQLMEGFKQLSPNMANNRRQHHSRQRGVPQGSSEKYSSSSRQPCMYESYIEICAENFEIMQVTTSESSRVKPFLSSTKEALYLPKEMNAFHIDYTTYYYKGTQKLPVPAANVFVHINPIMLTAHPPTCIWLNKFTSNMIEGLEWTKALIAKDNGPPEHVDTRIECLLPKIIIPCDSGSSLAHGEQRPMGMQIQLSQAIVTNCRVDSQFGSQSKLLTDLQHLMSSDLYSKRARFPNQSLDDPPLPSNTWVADYSQQFLQFRMLQLNRASNSLSTATTTGRDTTTSYEIWCIASQQLWVDFIGIESAAGRPVTFVDAIPIQLWISTPLTFNPTPMPSSSCCSTPGQLSRKASLTSLSSPQPMDLASPKSLLEHSQSVSDVGADRMGANATSSPHRVSASSFFVDTPLKSRDDYRIDGASQSEMRASRSDGDICAGSTDRPAATPSSSKSTLLEDSISDTSADGKTTVTQAMLLHVAEKVVIQLDHFQLLFLVRLQEMLAEMGETMARDQPKVSDDLSSNTRSVFVMNLGLNDVEVKLVLPECNGATEIQHLSLAERIALTHECEAKGLENGRTVASPTPSLPSSLADVKRSKSPEIAPRTSNGNALVNHDDDQLEPDFTIASFGRLELNSSPVDGATCNNPTLLDVDFSDPQTDRLLSMLSLDTSALVSKGRLERQSSGDTDEMTALVDTGEEMNSDFSTSQSVSPCVDDRHDEVASSTDKQISLVALRLTDVRCTIQAAGENVVVKVTSETLLLLDKGNRMYNVAVNDKIYEQDENGMPKAETEPALPEHGSDPMLKLRLELGPMAKQHDPRAPELGHAHIKLHSLNTSLLLTTADNLAEFAEDEKLAFTAAFTVELENCHIELKDDKPRRYLSAVKLPPFPIHIESLIVTRDSECRMAISRMRKQDDPENQTDNTTKMERSTEEQSTVVARSGSDVSEISFENERLIDDLKVSNSRVISLEQEREALIKVMDKLQQELMWSNRENDTLHAKYIAMQKMLAGRGYGGSVMKEKI